GRPAGDCARARGPRLLDERTAAGAARAARGEADDALGARDRRRARLAGRRPHDRGRPGPGTARVERHRRRAASAPRAAVRRSLRGEPRDRRVRDRRRVDERDGRRRDGALGFMTWQFVLTGLALGLIVGLTGVGGGSLMTPILIIVFGFKPTYAVGTDIFHGAIFKTFGAIRHRR